VPAPSAVQSIGRVPTRALVGQQGPGLGSLTAGSTSTLSRDKAQRHMIRLGTGLANEHEPELGSAYLPLEIRSQVVEG
jgi:hypothetical protein